MLFRLVQYLVCLFAVLFAGKSPSQEIVDHRIPLRTVARVSSMALLAQRVFFVGVPVVELVGQASSDPDWLVRSGEDWGRW